MAFVEAESAPKEHLPGERKSRKRRDIIDSTKDRCNERRNSEIPKTKNAFRSHIQRGKEVYGTLGLWDKKSRWDSIAV